MENIINGGYIILARRLIESEIWQKPPAYLKIWVYILFQVNYKNTKNYPRGSGLFNFKQERIPGVTLNQVYEFLRWAKTLNPRDLTTQITTQKTTRGIVIKVNNYNRYQDLNNYCHQDRNQHKKQHVTNTITEIKENNNSNTSYIKVSLSHTNEITKEEREILTNYVKRKKLAKSSIRAYVNAMIRNGDHIDILEQERQKLTKAEEEKKQHEEQIQEEIVSPEEEQKIKEIQAKTRAILRRRKNDSNSKEN